MTPAPSSDLSAAQIQRGLALVRDRFLVRLKRGAGFMCALCVAIALLLTAIDGGGLRYKLLYSFSIGLCCWLITDGTRLLTGWFAERERVLRGQPAGVEFHLGWRGLLPLMGLSIVVGPNVGMAVGDAVTGFDSPSLFNFGSTATVITLTITVIASLITLYVLTTLERLSGARSQAEAARREAAENQLRLLESQLEPHMLFNTLANLRVLIGTDPARAQAMLDRLIAFLRATLTASRLGQQPLADEFERVGDYLALMAVRMGPRLRFTLDLPPALRALPVPPLLLQPLVENSIRHGLEPQVAGGRIDIGASRSGSTLVLTVRDTGVGIGPAKATPAGTHFGLEQVRSRLAALYGDAATLALGSPGDAPGGTLARITLPVDTP